MYTIEFIILIVACAAAVILWQYHSRRRAVNPLNGPERSEIRQAQLEAIFMATPDPVLYITPQQYISMTNLAFTRVFGYPSREALGQDMSLLCADKKDCPRVRAAFETLGGGESVQIMGTHCRRRDNTTFDSEVVGVAVAGNDGRVKGYIVIIRDVTQRKAREDEMQNSFSQLAVLQQVDIELNSTLELEQAVMFSLNAAVRLSGADCGFLALSDHHHMIIQHAIGSEREGSIGAKIEPDRGVKGRVMNRHQAEFVRNVNTDPDYEPDVPGIQAVIVVPLLSQDKLIGLIVVETFETKRFDRAIFEFLQVLAGRIAAALENACLHRDLQHRLAESQALNARISNLEQLKTDMIRIAAHDIRNPLSIVQGYLSMLRTDIDQLSPEHQQFITEMERASDRMERILSDILSLERIEQMAEPASGDVIDLSVIVRQALTQYQSDARRNSQRISSAITDEGEALIRGAETQMYEAVVNLISNAIKYTPERGHIDVRLSVGDEMVSFTVTDDGGGIPEDRQGGLFQPFYRVRAVEHAQIEGTGLGLHLVKNIIERHDGTIIFQSTPGVGSIFGFRLPLIHAEADNDAIQEEAS